MTSSTLARLEIPIRMSFPVLAFQTFEVARARDLFERVAKNIDKQFNAVPFKFIPDPHQINTLFEKAKGKQLVIFDQYFHERSQANPEVMPALKASLEYFERLGISYVICSKHEIREEFVYHIDIPSMALNEILEVLAVSESIVGENLFTEEQRIELANHARGLSATQMKNVFILSAYLKHKGMDYLAEARREKAHILRDVGLDVMPTIDIEDVGGLVNIKEFLRIRQVGWNNDLPVKGMLLAGVPGGGKSLLAKATAHVFETTLVRLDMGKFYSKYLGETERLFNRALQTIEQISPVVVLIDEIEKFFGASEGDHEVSQRLLGNFLHWLQERKEKIFIVATANRVHALPPELMRAGRWDKAFFIDLPTDEEREVIFRIHLQKHNADLTHFIIAELLEASDGYTGAEIEQAVVDSMYLANADGNLMDHGMLLTALKQITPTSETRKADIDAIRSLRHQGFYPANEEPAMAPVSGPRQIALQ